MQNPDLSQIPLVSYIWIFMLSLLSGIATYLNRLCVGEKIKRPIIMFFKDVCYSLLSGFVTYFLAKSAGLSETQIIALVCIGSHMGARLIFALEGILIQDRLLKIINPNYHDNHDIKVKDENARK